MCAKGHICDPTLHLCCKGTNRCPKGYTEAGKVCGAVENSAIAVATHDQADECGSEEEICVVMKHSNEKICCVLEEPEKGVELVTSV